MYCCVRLCAGRPLEPVIAGCVVWQRVQCSWSPSVQRQTNYTGILPKQQIVVWKRGYDVPYLCVPLSCIVP